MGFVFLALGVFLIYLASYEIKLWAKANGPWWGPPTFLITVLAVFASGFASIYYFLKA